MSNEFELLLRKEIIAILDGDIFLGDSSDEIFRMPYLKGTELCELSDLFGLHQEYGASSRWTYLYNLLKYVIENNRCDELLCYMFDLERFNQLENLSSTDEIIQTHKSICLAAIQKINSKLALGRHELQVINGHFYITETGKAVQIPSSRINDISVPYIQGLCQR